MRRYSQSDEEKIRTQTLVREWERSGLIQPSQTRQLEAELRVDLKRTNTFFRAILFLFTTIIVAASFAFVQSLLDLDRDGTGIASLTAAYVCFVMAHYLVETFHFYRFGIEEACATAGVLFLAFGAGEITYENFVAA